MRKKKVCERCGSVDFCDDHHKYPKHSFNKYKKRGQKNILIRLCIECHDLLHNLIGHIFTHKGNEKPLEYYDEITDEFMNS